MERETTPFVLTPEMVYVMGGTNSSNYRLFKELCVRGYNIVRENGHLLLSLCSLMIATGMPQLSTVDDLEYLRQTLRLDLTDEEAGREFKKLIKKSTGNTRVRLNNFIHSMVN
ncbi:MAG: hypothetical protein Q8P67_23940 [archaeon]|nr:hypothetical protein [archaeon]